MKACGYRVRIRLRLCDLYRSWCTFKNVLSVTQQNMKTLETLNFDNLALRRLPIDNELRNYVRTVNAACFSKVLPSAVDNPKTVAYSLSAFSLLDLPQSELKRPDFAEYFSGNTLLPGSETAAHCYCGHQFGYFAGQLGDGAAMYLGEIINKKNERWEIQLKGAGLTPYSRTADGRKILQSSIREFLCSEAMHFLGIPTTRAGAIITSDTEVIRDIFYNGNPTKEKCTIVLRIAPTFIRFGSFEIFKTIDPITRKAGPSVGQTEILTTLLDYIIETFFPQIHYAHSKNQTEKFAEFFKEIVLRTARLVALWQAVGFCHGVLNTDNMSILGLTLDYGPFGFLDVYDPDHICNASDTSGRYTFSNQPQMCLWNLQKLAEAIQQALPLSVSQPMLNLYMEEFESHYLSKLRKKLGLILLELPEDKILIEELFNTMEKTAADFTNAFCCFSLLDATNVNELNSSIKIAMEKILEQCYSVETAVDSLKYNRDFGSGFNFLQLAISEVELENMGRQGLAIKKLITRQKKIKKLEALTPERKLQQDEEHWNRWFEKYKMRLIKEIDAQKDDFENFQAQRLAVMSNNNPRFILRNYIAEDAIKAAKKGDFSVVQNLMQILENPYDQSYTSVNSTMANVKKEVSAASCSMQTDGDNFDKPPNWAFGLRVT